MKLIKKKMTLEEYKKKYPHYRANLLSFSDKEIREINNDFHKYNENKENIKLDKDFLLKNRKWVHIGDRYYQVPGFSLTGFKSLSGAGKVGLSLGGAVIIAAAVVTPFFIPKASSGSGAPVTKEEFTKSIDFITEQTKDRNFTLTGKRTISEETENADESYSETENIKELAVDGYNEKQVIEDEDPEEDDEITYFKSKGENEDVYRYGNDKRWEYANTSSFPSEETIFSLYFYKNSYDSFKINGRTMSVSDIVIEDIEIPGREFAGIMLNVELKNAQFTFDDNNNIINIHEDYKLIFKDHPEEGSMSINGDYTLNKYKTTSFTMPEGEPEEEPVLDGTAYIGFTEDGEITTKKSEIDYYKIYCTASDRENWEPNKESPGTLIINSYYKGQPVKGVYYDSDKKLGGFENCKKIKNIVYNLYEVELDKNSFAGCTEISSYAFSESALSPGYFNLSGISYLGENAFADSAKNITEVKFPSIDNSNMKVDVNAFGSNHTNAYLFMTSNDSGCTYLLNYDADDKSYPYILLGGGITSNVLKNIDKWDFYSIADNAYKGNEDLTAISSLGNLRTIGDSAFEDCTKLADVTWPYTLTDIGKSAFKNTAIGDLDFSQNVTRPIEIEDYAFYNCDRITAVKMPYLVYRIGYSIFGNDDKTTLQKVIFIDNVKYEAYLGGEVFGRSIYPNKDMSTTLTYLTCECRWELNANTQYLEADDDVGCYFKEETDVVRGMTCFNIAKGEIQSANPYDIAGFQFTNLDEEPIDPSNFDNIIVIVNDEIVGASIDRENKTIKLNTPSTGSEDDVVLVVFSNDQYYDEINITTFK